MNSDTTLSIPALSGPVFDALPESIRSYIRFLEATIQKQQRGPVQHGERVQALIAYFAHQHFIPVDRLCQIFEDIFGIALSPGTCSNVDEKLFQQLESFESSLKTYLLAARILHFDETGMVRHEAA